MRKKKKIGKIDPFDILIYGKALKSNSFQTELGIYTIRIAELDGFVYFHKMRNGEILENVKVGKVLD